MNKKNSLIDAVWNFTDDGSFYPLWVIYRLTSLQLGLTIAAYEKRVINEYLNHMVEIDWFEYLKDQWGNEHYRKIQW